MLSDLRNDALLERLERAKQKTQSAVPKWPDRHLVGKDGTPVPFHRAQELIWESKRRTILFSAGSQVGKCLVGFVQLVNGKRVPVQDVKPGDQVLSLGDDLQLEFNTVTASFSTGIQSTYKVVTKSGREIIVTAEHPLLSPNGWLPAGEFQGGDFIGVPRALRNLGRKTYDRKLLRLLGYMIGDGGLTQKSLTFSNVDPDILEDLESCLPAPCKLKHWDKASWGIVGEGYGKSCINPVMRWMEELGLRWKYAKEKRIPEFVFELDDSHIGEVLAGLYLTDGCVHKLGLQFGNTSEGLVRDIQHLLLRLGITSSMRFIPLRDGDKWGVSDQYDLRFGGADDIRAFANNVRLVGIKAQKLEALIVAKEGISKNNQDRVPDFPLAECYSATGYKTENDAFRVTDREGYELCRQSRGEFPSRNAAKKMSERFGIGLLEANSDVYWDQIESVMPLGEMPVYDITVEHGHNFIANDIFAHNTSFLPWWFYREIQVMGPGDYLAITSSFDLLKLKFLPSLLTVFQDILKMGRYWAGDKVIELADPVSGKFWADKSTDPMWGRIILRSAQAPGGLESSTAKAAILDEAGQDEFPIDAYRAIKRRLTLNRGRLLLSTTLYSLNWLVSEIITPAMRDGATKTLTMENGSEIDYTDSEKTDTALIQADSIVNPEFPQAEYDEALASLPSDVFAMFYRGRVTRPRHMIYDVFDEEKHLCPPFTIPSEWPRWIGLDFGGVNTVAIYIAQDPKNRRLYFYREYHDGKKSAAEHVNDMMFGEPGIPTCYGGAKAEGQWRQEFRTAGLPVREPKVSDVWLGINRFYALLKEGLPDQARVQIFDNLGGLIRELNSYHRKTDSSGNPIDDEIAQKNTFHYADAGRYVCSSLPAEHHAMVATV